MYKYIWLRGKIKGLSHRAERKALRYSQGIGLSNASGLHLNMGTPHWGEVHKKCYSLPRVQTSKRNKAKRWYRDSFAFSLNNVYIGWGGGGGHWSPGSELRYISGDESKPFYLVLTSNVVDPH
jgi:hypothetical protein